MSTTETQLTVLDEKSETTEKQQDVLLYQKASTLKVNDEEKKALEQAVSDEIIEIRPDGLIYLPQVFVREKLNNTFGHGQWSLIQHRVFERDNYLYYDGSLLIRGCFVARAVGEHKYYENNDMQSWASVYESAKSDCLGRCCKDLGIGKELWQPAFIRKWKKEYSVQVWRDKTGKRKNGQAGSFQWRHKDADKFWDEKTQKNFVNKTDYSLCPSGEFKDKKWQSLELSYLSRALQTAKERNSKEYIEHIQKAIDYKTKLNVDAELETQSRQLEEEAKTVEAPEDMNEDGLHYNPEEMNDNYEPKTING